ncbi:hypothetical protein N7453_009697 [Penicillium expansum]|nr:hypothetical protein N7453_009697 [Penicillium expansum]
MSGRLLVLAFATITSAAFHMQQFVGNTCNLLDIWNQATNTISSVQYIQNENEQTLLLSHDCQAGLESILAKCLDGSGPKCTELLLSIAEWPPEDKAIPEGILSKRLNFDQSCSMSCSCPVSDLPIATISGIATGTSAASSTFTSANLMTSNPISGMALSTDSKSSTLDSITTISTAQPESSGSYSQTTSGPLKALQSPIARLCLIK